MATTIRAKGNSFISHITVYSRGVDKGMGVAIVTINQGMPSACELDVGPGTLDEAIAMLQEARAIALPAPRLEFIAERDPNGMITATVTPIPMRLPCPRCGDLHIDAGEFATKMHHTHACQKCGEVWRPAVVPTVGVRFLPGFKDDPVAEGK